MYHSMIHDQEVKLLTTTKLLGTIDKRLKWSDHINYINTNNILSQWSNSWQKLLYEKIFTKIYNVSYCLFI